MSRVDDLINIILKRSDLTKTEKLEKMYILIRKNRPKWNKYEVFEVCNIKYKDYQRMKQKIKNDEFVIY